MKIDQFERAERLRNNIKMIEAILSTIDTVDSLRLYHGEQQVLEIKSDSKVAGLKTILDAAATNSKTEFSKLLSKLNEDFEKL